MTENSVESGYLTDNTRISKKILSNGITCVVVNKKLCRQKHAMIAVKYGSCDVNFEVDGKITAQVPGVAHFLEHKMFECENGDVLTEFTKNNAEANAFTNTDTTAYHFTCTENFELNFATLCNMVNSLCISEDSVESEKKVIGSEINMYGDDASWKCYFSLLKAMYGKNPIGDEIAGTAQSIENIDAQTLKIAYDAFYTAENTVIVAVGDLDESTVFEQAENLLALKKGNSVKRVSEYCGIDKNEVTQSLPSVMPVFNIGFRIDGEYNLLKQATYDVLCEILMGDASPLFEKLYEKRILDFPLDYTSTAVNGAFALVLSGEGDEADIVANMLFEEVDKLKKEGFDDKVVKTAAKKLSFLTLKNTDDLHFLSTKVVECFVKNTEILDICKIYGKIDSGAVESALDSLCKKNMVMSKIGGRYG